MLLDQLNPNSAAYKEARAYKKYLFDQDASHKVSSFVDNNSDLILKHRQFALPGFEKTYIEIPLPELDEYSPKEWQEHEGGAIAFLFQRSATGHLTMQMMVGGPKRGAMLPLRYKQDGTANDPPHMVALKRRVFFFPKTVQELNTPALADLSESLVNEWTFDLVDGVPKEVFEEAVSRSTGMLILALGALLLLNQQSPQITMTGVSPVRRIHRGKSRVFLEHHVVAIDLTPQALVRNFSTGTKETPYEHDVEAHFVHYRVDRTGNCSHEWTVIPPEEIPAHRSKDVKRWRCEHCNGLRVFRREFKRGDPTKPKPETHYKVTDSSTKSRKESVDTSKEVH